jgi:hypothetical protein
MTAMAAFLFKTMVLSAAFVLFAQGGLAQDVKRCGWYANPTPGNHWLTDRHATWLLSTQGGAQVPGWLDLPANAFAFEAGRNWVETNGSYGYGCACVTGRFGAPATGEVRRVTALMPLPLSRCEEDPTLPGAED